MDSEKCQLFSESSEHTDCLIWRSHLMQGRNCIKMNQKYIDWKVHVFDKNNQNWKKTMKMLWMTVISVWEKATVT